MRELINAVLLWADERGLLANGNADRQALKAMSEFGEFADEILKGDKAKQEMELGDVIVTLILTAYKLGLDIEQALAVAYTKISNRKGETINGVFVKEEDLNG